MKTMKSKWNEVINVAVVKLAAGVMTSLTLLTAPAQARVMPDVVDKLDLPRYLGRWYEVASTHPIFQRGCVCVTADYSLRDDGRVRVINSCRKETPDAPLKATEGVATATSNPSKFNVKFGPIGLPFSNYWVVDLAPDYSYAVVSSPIKTPIWILSRTPELPVDVINGIYGRLDAAGFNTDAITPTLQDGCPRS